jgi:two-component system, chemotaxis family, protein-glutamate methylesterase/glutaminase
MMQITEHVLRLLAPPRERMTFHVIALAASAGGMRAIGQILSALPAHFSVPIVVLQHLSPTHDSMLADLLNRSSLLKVKQAEQGDRLKPGTVYVGPPALHLGFNRSGSLSLSNSPPRHFSKPSIDHLFESVAKTFGNRAIAVVLTGMGSDGSIGAKFIKEYGGIVIAQDIASSQYPSMPQATIKSCNVDHILPLDHIAEALMELAKNGPAEPARMN